MDFSFLFCLFYFPLIASALDKKVSVKEIVLDSPVEQLEWLGNTDKVVVCRTAAHHLYRSIDFGLNWDDLTHDLNTQIKAVVKNPHDPNVAVLIGKNEEHYITTNGGVNFSPFSRPGAILHGVKFHPKRSDVFLVSQWTSACHSPLKQTQKKKKCSHDLYLATHGAQEFTFLSSYVIQYAWATNSTKHLIYLTKFDMTKGSQPQEKGWSHKAVFGYIAPRNFKFHKLIQGGNKFLLSDRYLFVAKLIEEDRQHVQLQVSTDNGKHFKPILLPESLYENAYTIIDTSQDSVLLHVNHGHTAYSDINIGHVYSSGADGLRFSLSLASNIRSSSGSTEFEPIAGLPGIYVANYYVKAEESQPHKESKPSQIEDDDYEDLFADENDPEDASETDVKKAKRSSSHKGKVEAIIKTAISYDKGGAWSFLKAPAIDSLGKKIVCSGQPSDSNIMTSPEDNVCSLHLHGISHFERYAPVYSVENAVGLIIGTGNVGYSLSYDEDQVNTYLSRDGGITWVEAHKGAYIYEFGDYGGLIVMAHDAKRTNQVIFSWNEGQSWYDFDLGHEPVTVNNILTEPNATAVQFILYGTRGGSGILYHLDFSSLEQPICRGEWAPDSVSSDYETWSPKDGRTQSNCLNGQKIVYTRRKPTSECFNKKTFERAVSKTPCKCTNFDYQCEFGFSRLVNEEQCVAHSDTLTHDGCTSSSVFYTNAYRKIAGNQCVDGWVPSKVPVLCPADSPMSSRAHIILISFFILFILLALLTCSHTDKTVKSFLQDHGILQKFNHFKYDLIGSAPSFVHDSTKGYQSVQRKKTVHNPTNLVHHHDQDIDDDDDKNDIVRFVTSATSAPGPVKHSQSNDMFDEEAPPLLDFQDTSPYRHEGVDLGVIPYIDPPPSMRR